MNNPIQLVLPGNTSLTLPHKYMRHGENNYICITAPNAFIIVFNYENEIEIEYKTNEMQHWLNWFLKSEPISAAEFENKFDKAYEAIKSKMYGKAV